MVFAEVHFLFIMSAIHQTIRSCFINFLHHLYIGLSWLPRLVFVHYSKICVVLVTMD